MKLFRPPSSAPARAASPRSRLSDFSPGVDDPGERVFDLVLAHIRDRVPSLAHRPRHELEELFGDLRSEIHETVDDVVDEVVRTTGTDR